MNELETIAERIESAKVPEDLFGPAIVPESALRDAIALTYRRAVFVVHPDKHVGSLGFDRAQKAFRRATELKDQALHKVDAKTYGKPDVPPPDMKPKAPIVVEIKKCRFVVEDLLYSGDLTDIYGCSWAGGAGEEMRGLFKLVRNAGDNDLIENESRMLEKLGMGEERTEKVYSLFPRLHESFTLKGKSGSRRVLVIGHYPNHLSLAEVIAAFPKGIDYLDAAWMWKRMLFAVGHSHRRGIVHGGITPDHVLVHPTEHGAKLLDWTSAVSSGNVKLVSKKWVDIYPPEVMEKRPASAATDIYMLSACIERLLGLGAKRPAGGGGGAVAQASRGNQDPHEIERSEPQSGGGAVAQASRGGQDPRDLEIPAPISAFLRSCLLPAQGRRPDDAWRLHADLDELLKQLVGRPKYRVFTMPSNTA